MILAYDRKNNRVQLSNLRQQNIVKNGHNADGNQQFWCKDCGKRGVLEPKNSYSAEQKVQILAAYTNERSSMRGLEKHVPGLSRHIVYYSLGTPLTNEHYLNAARGNLYGIEKSPQQVGPWAFSPHTEFEGLYLCGASTLSHGVAGVTGSGIDAAKAVLNCRTRDLLKQVGASLTFLPSDGKAV